MMISIAKDVDQQPKEREMVKHTHKNVLVDCNEYDLRITVMQQHPNHVSFSAEELHKITVHD
jgi:hypothetical protein